MLMFLIMSNGGGSPAWHDSWLIFLWLRKGRGARIV